MTKLNNFSMAAAKVLEVLMWVALALVILGLIAACVGIGFLNSAIRENKIDTAALIEKVSDAVASEDRELAEIINKDNYDLAVRFLKTADILNEDGTVRASTVVFALIDAILHCAVFALIFRNIHLILKTAKGKTWFAEGETPFQSNITRMIREIGIFLLVLAGVELIFSFFSAVSVNLIFVWIGILMLCLSSFFRYGEQLQKDSDGLI